MEKRKKIEGCSSVDEDRESVGDLDDDDIEEDTETYLNDGEIVENALSSGNMQRLRRRSLHDQTTGSVGRQRRSSLRASMSKSMHDAGSTPKAASRRPPRKSTSAISSGMVLGDPSRDAPARSKSSDSFIPTGDRRVSPSSHSHNRRSRSSSNDFGGFLQQTGLESRSDLKISTHSYSSFAGDEEDCENPFEVTYQSNKKTSDELDNAWDPFSADNSVAEEEEYADLNSPKHERASLVPTKSGGLLVASSRDTISRGNLPKKVEEEKPKHSKDDAKFERGKQRRAEYKKSIAAATMAGRRVSGTRNRPV